MKNILSFKRVQCKQEKIFFNLEVWTETDKTPDTIITTNTYAIPDSFLLVNYLLVKKTFWQVISVFN